MSTNTDCRYSLALYSATRIYSVTLYSRNGLAPADSVGSSWSRTLTVMSETSTPELPTDWWTTADVLAFLEIIGVPISRATWSAYVARGQAPAPDRMFGR
jgi:hypothetical protein